MEMMRRIHATRAYSILQHFLRVPIASEYSRHVVLLFPVREGLVERAVHAYAQATMHGNMLHRPTAIYGLIHVLCVLFY